MWHWPLNEMTMTLVQWQYQYFPLFDPRWAWGCSPRSRSNFFHFHAVFDKYLARTSGVGAPSLENSGSAIDCNTHKILVKKWLTWPQYNMPKIRSILHNSFMFAFTNLALLSSKCSSIEICAQIKTQIQLVVWCILVMWSYCLIRIETSSLID